MLEQYSISQKSFELDLQTYVYVITIPGNWSVLYFLALLQVIMFIWLSGDIWSENMAWMKIILLVPSEIVMAPRMALRN